MALILFYLLPNLARPADVCSDTETIGRKWSVISSAVQNNLSSGLHGRGGL